MRKLLAFVFCLLALAGIAGAQTPPGAALSPGYLSIKGNQFVDSGGSNMRIASTSYRGTPTDQASMNAIRQAGFNAIRIDWRDGYLASGGSGTTTFDDEFATAPWLTHEAWVSGDKWSFAGTAFHTGVAQGPTWWANPNDLAAASSVYTDSGTSLNLSLINNPSNSGLSATACQGNPCASIGALINNQLTPGGLTQLFGDYQFSVAVPATPGFLFQWDIECQPAGCSDGSMEYDVGIWTDSSNVQHVQFSNQCCGGNTIYFGTTSIDITKQHVYEVNWQSATTTFYIDGVQQFQLPTPSGSFQTAVALTYFLTSDATYFGYASAGPSAANLPATASIDWYRVYQTKPTGTAPVGCNSLTQMDQCVALAAAATANGTPSPLKVIFSHRGNEIPSSPSSACNARQANGLWFDSGGSSGNDDGCSDGGNVTYAQFKANTASLMQRYAGNSTVIGYDFHAEPLVNGAFTGTGGGGATGQFSVNSSGQIIDPNGNVWIARGFSVTLGDAQGGTTGPVSLANIQRVYPRTNYIRIWGDYPSWTPSALNSWISSLTNAGIAVAIEDYTGNGFCRSGGDLSGANAWYQAAASFYKSNPGVIFESQNECFDGSGGGPSQTQIQTNYNAVRAGGYTGLFFIGSAGGSPDPGNGEWYFSNTLFAPMTNIGFDIHPYPDAYNSAGVAATQSAFNAQLRSWIQSYSQWHTNTEPSVPVIAGEIGNCGNTPQCNGNNNSNNVPIVNWQLAVHAVAQVAAVSGNNSTGVSAGVGYWQWGDDGDASNVDTLTIGGNATNPYGVQVQGDIAGMAGTGPTPFTGGGGGGTGANPPVNWGGGGDTDILAACNDVGAAVFAVNPGVIQFCEGPLNNGANNLLSGAAKP